jgi:uncharacterized protein
MSSLPPIRISPDTSLGAGLAGGVLVALSSSALFYFTGEILGISGILGTTLSKRRALRSWRAPFLAGLVSSGALLALVYPEAFGSYRTNAASALKPSAAILAGLLVGVGTRMSSGCTSGHGVCGLGRRSPRSLVAVLTFMGSGMVAAYLVRANAAVRALLVADSAAGSVGAGGGEVFGAAVGAAAAAAVLGYMAFGKGWATAPAGSAAAAHEEGRTGGDTPAPDSASPSAAAAAAAAANAAHTDSFMTRATAGVVGLIFGAALGLSGMTDTERLVGFLDVTRARGVDLTMMGVMGGAVCLNLLTFGWMGTQTTTGPAFPSTQAGRKSLAALTPVGLKGRNLDFTDPKLVLGSVLFGAGWGIGGICPGPGIVAAAAGIPLALVLTPSIMAGMAIHDLVF